MRLFVRNIPLATRAADLVELFAAYGHVRGAKIPTDGRGHQRDFAYVIMPNAAEAQAAMAALHGSSLDGRPITVTEAREPQW